jgi:hypothetical protein
MRSTGLSVIIGSWKIIATRLPRTRCSARGDSCSRSICSPLRCVSSTLPPTTLPGGSTRPSIE